MITLAQDARLGEIAADALRYAGRLEHGDAPINPAEKKVREAFDKDDLRDAALVIARIRHEQDGFAAWRIIRAWHEYGFIGTIVVVYEHTRNFKTQESITV